MTINTLDRHRAFLNEVTVRLCLHSLKDSCDKHSMTVLAYCFMPDHLHLLLEGSDRSNLVDFMKRFKQLSGFGNKTKTGHQLWQKGYYDHVVRQEEDLKDIARYIFENPCRARIVNGPALYPYSGGEYFEPMLERQPEGSPYGGVREPEGIHYADGLPR
ncbi:MAG: transposase [Chloroflexota bacterium]